MQSTGERSTPSHRRPAEQAQEAAADGGGPHGLAWTGGAGALRTGWKRIGVGVYASVDVRGGARWQVEGRLAL